MPIEQPPLPYAKDALAPHMSGETLEYHYGKHHKKYVDVTNDLIKGTPHENKSLEEIVEAADGKLFNQSAQVWNHNFFWNCMKPGGGGAPSGDLAEKIKAKFGSIDDFKQKFKEASAAQFGSGWAWLVKKGDGVDIVTTSDADNPLKHGQTALLTCDVWEHAYYIDYRNARPKYVEAFLDHLVNWDFVAERLK